MLTLFAFRELTYYQCIYQIYVCYHAYTKYMHENMHIFIILISVLCFDAIIRSYEVLEEREITLKRIWRNSLKILNFRYNFCRKHFFP